MTNPESVRIAMWSGPRNISTAMMRAFGQRSDAAVIDEPFYAAYLAATGLDHPMREAVLAAQPTDWRRVVEGLLGPVPDGRAIYYQKHMSHHMLPAIGRDWIATHRNAFLIRAPEAVLASYSEKRAEPSLIDIGLPQQIELFEREADRLGVAPPVIDSRQVLENPRATLLALCAALGVPFSESMLSWPPGRRGTDGAWAAAWYDSVEKSTGFGPPRPEAGFEDLPDSLKPVAEAARPLYERLAAQALNQRD